MDRPLAPAEDAEEQPVRLLETLGRLTGHACAGCGQVLCGHAALFSVALGYKDRPHCPGCLARILDWATADLRDHVLEHVQARECYRKAWARTGEEEGFGPAVRPPCLWPPGDAAGPTPLPERADRAAEPSREPAAGEPVLAWDAGDMGCGELVLALRLRLQELPVGALLAVTARDPAAPEDLPAWCRLTGHHLLRADHPQYVIRRRRSTEEA